MPTRFALLATLLAAAPLAAEPPEPGGAVSTAQDLQAVLALRGLPCRAVDSHERLGPADYAVRCRDGERYRIHVDADGRVQVKRQPGEAER